MTVSVGRMKLPRSARLSWMRWWSRCRWPPRIPYQLLRPRVTPVRLWCLATGRLMILSAARERLQDRPHAQQVAAEIDPPELALLGQHHLARPPARAASAMPLRWNERCGSLMHTSVTMTVLAPASTHSRTVSATTTGLVLAACSGVRSQETLGLMTTTSPRAMNRRMPPSSVTARRKELPRVLALEPRPGRAGPDRLAP